MVRIHLRLVSRPDGDDEGHADDHRVRILRYPESSDGKRSADARQRDSRGDWRPGESQHALAGLLGVADLKLRLAL
jgi:hypothetical protein